MAPQRRKDVTNSRTSSRMDSRPKPAQPAKRITKTEREQMICHKKIKALNQEESISNDDRFTFSEKERLLEAYYANGFKVFQDIKLLQQYFPERRENDLKSLLERLCHSLQTSESNRFQAIDDWQQICQNLVRNFSRDKKVSLDEVLTHALTLAAEQFKPVELDIRPGEAISAQDSHPDYYKLLIDISELLRGRFPDNTSPINAAISMHLYDHINELANSIDATAKLETLLNGSWLMKAAEKSRQRHESALKGIRELGVKECPTKLSLENNPNIEALCLELPKIKRIVEVLNPMHMSDDLINDIFDG